MERKKNALVFGSGDNLFLRSIASQPNYIKVTKKIVGPLTIGRDQVLGVTIGTYRENKRRMKKF